MAHHVALPGGLNSDASGTAPSVGNVLGTIARNNQRKGAFVQNQSAVDLQVVLDDGIGSTATIIIIAAASVAGSQGGAWDTSAFLHLGRIRICGTASSQFSAAELL